MVVVFHEIRKLSENQKCAKLNEISQKSCIRSISGVENRIKWFVEP